ncbi:MAG: PEP-CTERM sorting domain-containing protein [Planctomycetota bacterium]|nr:PEP-CTERM sorting domain-containing protein [Planctomycetota bacterium]
MSSIFGIVSFTAVSLASSGGPAAGVPETSTLAGCLVVAVAAGVRRRRQRRKLQLESADRSV